jgi:sugar O-acyltransferase (sialic acid O-acetyltransferase NeuD family)
MNERTNERTNERMNGSMNATSTQVGELLILGGGGHAAVVAECAARVGWRVIGFAAAAGTEVPDPDGVGAAEIERVIARGGFLHAAVGAADVRERWMTRFGARHFAAIVDPSANVSPTARVGAGVFVATCAVVHARAVIGDGVIVNTRAVVEHDCTVEAFAHVAPAAVLCGSVRVGRGAQVSAGAVVIPARTIGAGAMVGAGAVVVRDVPANATVVGVPARVVTSTSPTR